MSDHEAPAFDDQETILLDPGSDAWVDSCWNSMREAAAAGERPDAREFIEQLPRESPEKTLDLLYGEYVIRRSSGEEIDLDAFIDPYPRFAAAFQKQIALEEMLSVLDEGADPSEVLTVATLECRSDPSVPLASRGQHNLSKKPDSVGRYRIVNPIATGGQAQIFRAFDPKLQRDVVVKLEATPDEFGVNSFGPEEAVVQATLEHANLTPILDAGEHDGKRYLVSAYIEGVTLERWVHNLRPSETVVAEVIAKAARAMSHAHERGILHLDIKPANVLIDHQTEPHVIDFGMAVVDNSIRLVELREGSIRGTLGFMAPEQVRGESARVCGATDVFGMGATLLFALTGKPPYPSVTIDNLQDVRSGNWDRSLLEDESISKPMREVVNKALASDLDTRYASMGELENALEQCTAEHKTQLAGPSDQSRGSWNWWLVAGALLMLAASASLLWTGNEPGSDAQISVLALDEDGRFVALPDHPPLSDGAKLRVEGTLPPGRQAVLFAIGTGFDVSILQKFRGRKGHFSYPKSPTGFVPLQGESGTEIIGLITGDDAAIIVTMLHRFAESHRLGYLPIEDAIVTFDRGTTLVTRPKGREFDPELVSQIAGASRDLGEPQELMGQPRSAAVLLEELNRLLQKCGADLTAVAFPHVDG